MRPYHTLLPLFLAACMPTVPAPVAHVVHPESPPATLVTVDLPRWSMELPEGWLVKPPSDPHGRATREMLARSPDLLGSAPLIIGVLAVQLSDDDPPDADFGEALVETMADETNGDETLLATQPVTISGRNGVIATLVTTDYKMVAELAVASNRTGFVVRCGGDLKVGDKIIEKCSAILKTFHLKP